MAFFSSIFVVIACRLIKTCEMFPQFDQPAFSSFQKNTLPVAAMLQNEYKHVITALNLVGYTEKFPYKNRIISKRFDVVRLKSGGKNLLKMTPHTQRFC